MAAASAEKDSGVVLKDLPYKFEALEPAIDAETMKLHWGKHHKTYTEKANDALRGLLKPEEKISEDLKRAATQALNDDEDQLNEAIRLAIAEESAAPPTTKKLLRTLRNNGGGFSNHNDYWNNLAPIGAGGGGEPTNAFGAAINKRFGSFDQFKEKFVNEGLGVFGSGWVWLVVTPKASLEIVTTPNQDRPLDGSHVIIGCDVWEHAYYLKHNNRRQDYLNTFWKVVNFNVAGKRFEHAIKECTAKTS